MPSAYMVSFLPLGLSIQNGLLFAKSLASAGWNTTAIEIDSISNGYGSVVQDGICRITLPMGWRGMPNVLRPVRGLLRYIYFALGAAFLRAKLKPGDLVVAADIWSLFLVSLAAPLERVVYYEFELPAHLTDDASFFNRYLRRFLLRNGGRCALLISCERNRLKFLRRLLRAPRTALVHNMQARGEIPATLPDRALSARPRILYAGSIRRPALASLVLVFFERARLLYDIEHYGHYVAPEFRDEYKRIAALPGVTAHGFVPRNELVKALRRVDASLVVWDPYSKTYFGAKYCAPHKFFEAPAFGVPTICSPNIPIKGWMAEYKVGEIFDELTVDSMLEACARLFQPETYTERRRECRRAVSETWNFESEMRPVIDAIMAMPVFTPPSPPPDR